MNFFLKFSIHSLCLSLRCLCLSVCVRFCCETVSAALFLYVIRGSLSSLLNRLEFFSIPFVTLVPSPGPTTPNSPSFPKGLARFGLSTMVF
jgi:hypothetical protein